MIYDGLVVFPKFLRSYARELHPAGITEADLLAQLIARYWLTNNREEYLAPPYGFENGKLSMKPALRVGKSRDEIKTYRVHGTEGLASQAMWTIPAVGQGYTHLWLWYIAPESGGDHYAHHWRGELSSLPLQPKETTILAVKDLMELIEG